jgi:hypothetical protein
MRFNLSASKQLAGRFFDRGLHFCCPSVILFKELSGRLLTDKNSPGYGVTQGDFCFSVRLIQFPVCACLEKSLLTGICGTFVILH